MATLSKIKTLRDALKGLGVPLYHYKALNQPAPYVVWSEDGFSQAERGDGKIQDYTIGGTVDYFTKTEYDPAADLIQDTLNDAGFPLWLEFVGYEDDTGLIHYQWVFEV